MDDRTFESLKAALSATPDNVALLGVLLNACLERAAPSQGCALLEGRDLSALPATDRLTAARLYLAADRVDEARRVYRGAIEENPALEDIELAKRLSGQVREIAPTDGPRLRVISNDDTS